MKYKWPYYFCLRNSISRGGMLIVFLVFAGRVGGTSANRLSSSRAIAKGLSSLRAAEAIDPSLASPASSLVNESLKRRRGECSGKASLGLSGESAFPSYHLLHIDSSLLGMREGHRVRDTGTPTQVSISKNGHIAGTPY